MKFIILTLFPIMATVAGLVYGLWCAYELCHLHTRDLFVGGFIFTTLPVMVAGGAGFVSYAAVRWIGDKFKK